MSNLGHSYRILASSKALIYRAIVASLIGVPVFSIAFLRLFRLVVAPKLLMIYF